MILLVFWNKNEYSNYLQNPAISDIYTEHSCSVNVAKYSPSGFYIASGGTYSLIVIFLIETKSLILLNIFAK